MVVSREDAEDDVEMYGLGKAIFFFCVLSALLGAFTYVWVAVLMLGVACIVCWVLERRARRRVSELGDAS